MSLWVRARRTSQRLEVGIGLRLEGVTRAVRNSTWSASWASLPTDRWRQTSSIQLNLPAAPHPEVWEPVAGMAAGARLLEVDQRAPEFQLPALGGNSDALTSLSEMRAGNRVPTVIVFWSSWAPMAAETLMGLTALDATVVRVIGINVYETSLGEALALSRVHGSGLEHYADADASVALHYRVDGLPELYLLDSSGVLRTIIRGPAELSAVRSALAALD